VPAKVYFFPHPFTSERREETIESGATLESIVKNARSDIPHGLMVRTYINGKLISNNDRIKTIVNDVTKSLSELFLRMGIPIENRRQIQKRLVVLLLR